MARILALAPSGFGKTTGLGKIDYDDEKENVSIHLQGLNPQNSYVLSVTSKPLPWRGSGKSWPVVPMQDNWTEKLNQGRRFIADDPDKIVKALEVLALVPHDKLKTVVLDDLNYIMQDWYMANALRTGWDAPKKIGYEMGRIFKAIEAFNGYEKHIIVLAHGEPDTEKNKTLEGRSYWKFKTTGKMVDEYVTPEGKFDITLVGRSRLETKEGKKIVVKEYVTNEDELFASPKSPIGMFPKYISNDLGKIIEMVESYYNGE